MPIGEKTKELWKNKNYKKHMSEVHKKPMKEYFKTHSQWNKGKKMSDEFRLNLSKSQEGNKSHFWKGGITPKIKKIRNSLQYKLWRETVFERDNYTCQKCGKIGGKLNVHHIVPFKECLDLDYEELIYDLDNGITYCEDYHKQIHGI